MVRGTQVCISKKLNNQQYFFVLAFDIFFRNAWSKTVWLFYNMSLSKYLDGAIRPNQFSAVAINLISLCQNLITTIVVLNMI